jgi:S-adenosylmethionine decarboxylase
MRTLGQHALIDFYNGDPQILSCPDRIREILLSAIRLSGLTIVLDTFHHFKPNGVSGVVVIAESHVTIHTWPEHGYAAVDIFTCGESLQSDVIQSAIQKGIRSTNVTTKSLLRGCLPHDPCR